MANGDPNDSYATARALTTTLVDFLRKEEVQCFRKNVIGREVSQRGNVMLNASGLGLQWEVRNKRHTVFGNDGTNPLSFQAQNQWRNASLPERGFGVTDSMFVREFKSNRGKSALIKVFSSMGSRMKASMEEAFSEMWIRDGSSASDKLPQGINTFMGDSGFTIDTSVTTGPQSRAENAGDIAMWPTGSYAGLSMVLGADGGNYLSTIASGSGTTYNWPMGKADPQYDYWTPIVVNAKTTNANIGGTADTWNGQGKELIRFVKTYLGRNRNGGAKPDLCTMGGEWFRILCDTLDDSERSIVTVAEGKPQTKSFGMDDVTYVDGLKCTWDYSIDENAAYIWNLDGIEVRSMDDELFPIQGPEYDMPSQSYRWASVSLLNIIFNSPANYGKIANLT